MLYNLTCKLALKHQGDYKQIVNTFYVHSICHICLIDRIDIKKNIILKDISIKDAVLLNLY